MAGPAQTHYSIGGENYQVGDGSLVFSGNQPYAQKNGQYYAIQNGQLASGPSPLAAGLPGNGTGNNIIAGQPGGNVASPPTNTANYSQLLPSQTTYQSFTPLSYQDFGSVPYVQAATTNAASVDNSSLPGALQGYEGAVNSAMAPQFQQQQDQLNSGLAQRGIYNSSAGQELQNNLTGQQDAALSSAYEPLIAQFAGDYNANNQLNAQMEQQASLANQGAYNNANTTNAQAYGTAVGANYDAYNQYLQTLMGYQNGTQNTLLDSYINSYNPSQYANLLSGGLANASGAYTNAYNGGAPGTANLSNALSQLGSQLGSGANKSGGGADMGNSSFSDY